MTYDSFLDSRDLTIWTSSTGKRHVEGWFSESLCGSYIERANGWSWLELTSLRYLAKIAQWQISSPAGGISTVWCKRCLSNYKDVKI